MSFFVAGCVLLLALLLGIAIDDASTGRRPEKGSMQTHGVHYAAAAVVPSSLAGRKPR
jgi:hypothetical protein